MSKYNYTRKMLDKNHLEKVPSKAVERWKLKRPYYTNSYQVNISVMRVSSLHCILSQIGYCFSFLTKHFVHKISISFKMPPSKGPSQWDFLLLNGFWPLRGGGQQLAVNFCDISTKITLINDELDTYFAKIGDKEK